MYQTGRVIGKGCEMSVMDVTMPRLGVNDEYVTLTEWLLESGSRVSMGQEIASIETTKEASEIKAEENGFLFYEIEAGSEIKVGSQIAVISSDASYEFVKTGESGYNVKLTERAKQLIEKHNIDIQKLSHLKIIREKDVLPLVEKRQTVVRSKANDVIIVCGGGLAKMCIDLLRLNKAYNIHGFTDADETIGEELLGVPYLGTDDLLSELHQNGYMTAINAIGSIGIDNTKKSFMLRKIIYEKIKDNGFFLPTLIHPSAEIAPTARLGEGTLVFENAVIGSDAQIGDDCLINTGAIVSHDCQIGNHTRISPGAILAGDVKIGENSLIGMGVTIYLGVTIGENVIIANGQNIIGDVPDNAIIK